MTWSSVTVTLTSHQEKLCVWAVLRDALVCPCALAVLSHDLRCVWLTRIPQVAGSLTDCSPSRGEPTPNQPCGEAGASFGPTAARVWRFLTAAGLFSLLLFVWRKKTDDWQTFRFFWASCRWWLSSCRQMWDGKTRSEPLRTARNQKHQLQLSFSLQWL